MTSSSHLCILRIPVNWKVNSDCEFPSRARSVSDERQSGRSTDDFNRCRVRARLLVGADAGDNQKHRFIASEIRRICAVSRAASVGCII